MIEDMERRFSTGVDEYPTDLHDAYIYLTSYKADLGNLVCPSPQTETTSTHNNTTNEVEIDAMKEDEDVEVAETVVEPTVVDREPTTDTRPNPTILSAATRAIRATNVTTRSLSQARHTPTQPRLEPPC